MKIIIAAIGKAKASPEQELLQGYLKRLPWKTDIKEFDSKRLPDSKRKTQEGEWLLQTAASCDRLIALDESGKPLSSREFAGQLDTWRQSGHSSYAFVIGGSDGLDNDVLKKAHLVWSLGKVTWPHMLVRALIAEQLYRAWSVLTNHPYHRG